MNKFLLLLLIAGLFSGCSGKIRLGYMVDAEGKAEWKSEEVKND